MSPADYGELLADREGPISEQVVEGAARILAAVEDAAA